MTGADGGERLEGVSCIAAPGGGYDVSLRLVCDLVPLHPLGELVRAAVGRAAATAGIELERVGRAFRGSICERRAVMVLLRALARLTGAVWMLVLALLGLGIALYCFDALISLGWRRGRTGC